jgi:P-type conjugative transfer ATPase TrbB
VAVELSRTHTRFVDMLDHVLKPIQAYLDDLEVTDIVANPDATVWIKRFSRGWEGTDLTLLESDRRMILDLLAARQSDELHAERPSLSTVLPGGARIEGTIPPLSEAPTFAIRIRARSIYSLEDFQRDGILTTAHVDLLRGLVEDHRNVIIGGPTGSAKTTLLNALLLEIDPEERVIVLEDTPELQVTIPNLVTLWTREGVADLRALVRKAMRLQPDRIIVGEVRGVETLDFLKALNTGHQGGMCTVHAESTASALLRLETLVQEAVAVVPRALISQTIHVVVSMAPIRGGRPPRVVSVDRVEGMGTDGEYRIIPLSTGGRR